MAIKIPSKKIYNKSIQKVRDNAFDKVFVETTIISPYNEYNVPVYIVSSEPNYGVWNEEEKFVESQFGETVDGTTYTAFSIAYAKLDARYGNIGVINIPIFLENKYISQIFSEKDKDGENNIKYRIIGDIRTGKCKVNFSRTGNYQKYQYNRVGEIEEYDVETKKDQTYYSYDMKQIDQPEKYTSPFYASSNAKTSNTNATSEIYFEDNSTISTAKPSINDNYFVFGDTDSSFLHFIVGLYRVVAADTIDETTAEFSNSLNGIFTEYTPKKIEVSIYGNTIGIDLTDGTVTVGEGNSPFSLSGNELLQESNTTNGEKTTKVLADNILEQYKNGKETATILCEIANYFDYDTEEKKISIDNSEKMCFDIGDRVIPMTFSYSGKDVPMSLYKDGSPKVFSVVGTKIFYDGAVWQELTLQEVTQ